MSTSSIRTGKTMRPNFRTIQQFDLHRAWMASYWKNKEHALRDANLNLKGFTRELQSALQHYQVDHAFSIAIRRALRNV